MKKILAIALVLSLGVVAFAGCSSDKKKNETGNKKLKIGIAQYVQHNALDESRKGFIAALKEAGYEDGKNIALDYQNASADSATNATIAETFANDKKDLILAIATPTAVAIANKVKDVPILVTAVTDPAKAKLVDSNEDVKGNVSGTSDLSPVSDQLDMIKKIKPDAKTVGIIYSSAEDNSIFLSELAQKKIKELGLESKIFTVKDTNDVKSVMEALVGKVDVLYAPTDNIISASMATVTDIAVQNKLPVIAGEEEQVKNGALVTKGINYFELGKMTGEMAVKILKGEKKVEDFPIQYAKDVKIKVNKETAKKIGINDIEALIK